MHMLQRLGFPSFAVFLLLAAAFSTAAGLLLQGCSNPEGPAMELVAGSESKAIEDIIKDYAEDNGFTINVRYMGSVDQMRMLRAGRDADNTILPNAVLPASSLWIRLGDVNRLVSDEAAIMRTPIVFALKTSKAEALGWKGRKDVTIREDILPAVQRGELTFAMTSATQSNSGAAAYLGMLTALVGKDTALTSEDLDSPELQQRIMALLRGQERSSGSSGWLAEAFPTMYDQVDGLFNYEAMIVEVNAALQAQGKEPLFVIYPVDGLAVADQTLGYVNSTNDPAMQERFIGLRDYLLSEPVQQEIAARGFRTGVLGLTMPLNEAVFPPSQGFDTTLTISPAPLPKGDVIEHALALYQGAVRKPSFTVFCIDVSGSMQGAGLEEAKQALYGLLRQELAQEYLLQSTPEDVVAVIPFSSHAYDPRWAQGPGEMERLAEEVAQLQPGGKTNIYDAVVRALDFMESNAELARGKLVSIVLMTDGRSNLGEPVMVSSRLEMLSQLPRPPIFAITFGKADPQQLSELTTMGAGRVFDSSHGLAQAFRKAKGYN